MSFGSFEHNNTSPMAEINVTPFVDIMLVLLIVFMVTMPILTHTIPLQLPVSSENKTTSPPSEPIKLSININGEYYLNEELVTLPELEKQLRDIQSQNAEAVLAVAADQDVSYKKVVDALSAAQMAEISKIGFVTEMKQP
ncbi:ExbD/TolR family protein [Testudinibacter sp. P27/CKL/0425]